MSRSTFTGGAGALCLVAALSGCSGQDGSGSLGSTDDGGDKVQAVASVAWEAPLHPVSEPVAAGDVAVVYAADGQDLWLVGLDSESGEEVWRQAATPSLTPPGMVPEVDASRIEDSAYVATLERVREMPLQARLIVLDSATGEVIHRTQPQYFASWPQKCTDGADFCVRAKDDAESGTPIRWHRLDLASEEYEPTAEAPEGSRFLDDDIVELGSRDPEFLARVEDGGLLWKTPLTEAFPPGSTSDNGWDITTDHEVGVVYGTIGGPIERAQDDFSRVIGWNLAAGGIAALDMETGEVFWKRSGYVACLGIEADPLDPDSAPLPVRCAATGNAEGVADDMRYQGLNLTLEGFDPLTGETTWSVPLGDPQPVPRSLLPFAYASADEVVVSASGDPLVVNLRTGSTRAPRAGEQFSCSEPTHYEFADAIYYSGTPVTRRSGAATLSGCNDAREETADGAPAEGAVEVGVPVGGVVLVSEYDRVVAYTTS